MICVACIVPNPYHVAQHLGGLSSKASKFSVKDGGRPCRPETLNTKVNIPPRKATMGQEAPLSAKDIFGQYHWLIRRQRTNFFEEASVPEED